MLNWKSIWMWNGFKLWFLCWHQNDLSIGLCTDISVFTCLCPFVPSKINSSAAPELCNNNDTGKHYMIPDAIPCMLPCEGWAVWIIFIMKRSLFCSATFSRSCMGCWVAHRQVRNELKAKAGGLQTICVSPRQGGCWRDTVTCKNGLCLHFSLLEWND